MNKKLLKNFAISALALITLSGCGYRVNTNDTSSLQGFVQSNLNSKVNKQTTANFRDKLINGTKEKLESGANQLKEKGKEYLEDTKEYLKENIEEHTKLKNVTTASDQKVYDKLANVDWEPGTAPIVTVNKGKSTLSMSDWKAPKINYSKLDSLNRAGTAVAYLQGDSYGKSEGREGQVWKPTGFQNQPKTINGKKKYPYDRGHLIAYTLSFNFTSGGKYKKGEEGSLDNPKNLFTQTAYSNRTLLQRYEREVRDAIKSGEKVIYRVQPVFRGDELVARGLWAQAVSSKGTVNFNDYIHNVEPGFKIDFSTGKTRANAGMVIPK